MKVKRLRWKNSEAATEKQIAYISSLVAKWQGAAERSDDKIARAYWSAVEVPGDLTKVEATGLIEDLKSVNQFDFLPGWLETALDALEAGKVTGATKGIMIATVFYGASNAVLEMAK